MVLVAHHANRTMVVAAVSANQRSLRTHPKLVVPVVVVFHKDSFVGSDTSHQTDHQMIAVEEASLGLLEIPNYLGLVRPTVADCPWIDAVGTAVDRAAALVVVEVDSDPMRLVVVGLDST